MGYAKEHLSESELAAIARELFQVKSEDQHKGELHGLCPIHGEKNPSFSYNYKKDQYSCFSCSAAGDIIKLWAHVNGITDDKESFKEFCRKYDIESSDGSSPHPVYVTDAEKGAKRADLDEALAKMPVLPEPWLKRLQEVRGWSKDIMAEMDLRLQTVYRSAESGKLVTIAKPERVAIPVKDKSRTLVNIRLYKPGAKQMKIISWGKGHGSARLFPAQPKPDGIVLLCEGEQDTLCALSNGFNAITQTSKTKNWPKDHLKVFRDRDVVIAYDADQPGEKYAAFAAAALVDGAKSVKVLTWPDEMGRQSDGSWPKDHGQDLTDFFVKFKRTSAELQNLMDEAKAWEKPLSSAEYMKFFENGASGRLSFKPRMLAERILEDICVMVDPTSEQYYLWNNKFWELFDEAYIERRCMELLGVEAQKNRIKDASFQVKIASTLPHGRALNDRAEWVCLKNCMLNLHTLEARPHAKDYYCTVSLDITWAPEKANKCDRFKAFLKETVQTPEVIDQVQEFAGYCLTRDTRYAKCLLAIGPGADGKTTLIKILRKMVGPENTSAISFQDLEDQFLRSSLYNKLLNISTEVGSRALESPYFKAITSGDPISAAYKHKDTFTFIPYCKLIFAANKLPRVLDNSDGFFRRVLPVEFKRQFLYDADVDLYETLEKEMPGIFEWAVVGYHRLVKQRCFTDCNETRDLLLGYRRLNNPVLCYVEDRCILGDEYEAGKDALYIEFRNYCASNGYNAFNKENFFRELYAAISHLKIYRPTVDGVREYRVKGIGISALGGEV